MVRVEGAEKGFGEENKISVMENATGSSIELQIDNFLEHFKRTSKAMEQASDGLDMVTGRRSRPTSVHQDQENGEDLEPGGLFLQESVAANEDSTAEDDGEATSEGQYCCDLWVQQ